MIRREVERMTTFIAGLLHLSRTQRLAGAPVDVCAMTEEVIADIAPLAAEQGVNVSFEAADGAALVAGHETMLRHALHNVLRNAVQAAATDAGGWTKQVAVRVDNTGTEIALVVEDTGSGISQEDLPRVFEPFHTTRADSSGIGLGLPVSRGIVEEHGGRITIENRAEGGVRAAIILPLADAGAAPLDTDDHE